MNIINGSETRIWIDKWCLSVPLWLLFLDLYSIAMDPIGPVRAHWSNTSWNIKVPYSGEEDNLTQREELFQHLASNLSLTRDIETVQNWNGALKMLS